MRKSLKVGVCGLIYEFGGVCFLIDGSVPLLKSQSQRFVIFKVNGEVSCIKVRVSKGFFNK